MLAIVFETVGFLYRVIQHYIIHLQGFGSLLGTIAGY